MRALIILDDYLILMEDAKYLAYLHDAWYSPDDLRTLSRWEIDRAIDLSGQDDLWAEIPTEMDFTEMPQTLWDEIWSQAMGTPKREPDRLQRIVRQAVSIAGLTHPEYKKLLAELDRIEKAIS